MCDLSRNEICGILGIGPRWSATAIKTYQRVLIVQAALATIEEKKTKHAELEAHIEKEYFSAIEAIDPMPPGIPSPQTKSYTDRYMAVRAHVDYTVSLTGLSSRDALSYSSGKNRYKGKTLWDAWLVTKRVYCLVPEALILFTF